jgi:thiol-disulfide isomerase/thioredoxin
LLTFGASALAANDAESTAHLRRSVESYASAPELVGSMRFTIEYPDGRQEPKEMLYGRRGDDALATMVLPDGTRVLEVVALDGSLYASQFNVKRAFVERPIDNGLFATLTAIGADQVGLKLPAPVAAAVSGELEPFLDALGFGVLGPLEVGTTTVSSDGTELEIELTAGNGTNRIVLDAESHHLLRFAIVIGEPGHQVRGTGVFEALEPRRLAELLAFEPAGRTPVADFAELEASAYPLGQPAPEASVATLAGGSVSLADLQGSVVVLDFWATWCVPCWTALPEIEGLAEWARDSGKPVVVYSVSTQEQVGDLDEQREMVNEFLGGRDLSLPTLLDPDGSFFAAMHSPGLPSTVVIAPDGTLARYHSGVAENLQAVLTAEVEELLE